MGSANFMRMCGLMPGNEISFAVRFKARFECRMLNLKLFFQHGPSPALHFLELLK